jgi:hypothetical protein
MLSWFLGDATKIPGRFQKVAWCQQNSARRKYTFRKGYIYNGITRYQGLFPIYFKKKVVLEKTSYKLLQICGFMMR